MMILNPITLPASKMLDTMTTLLADIRVNETIAPSVIVNRLVDTASVGNVDYGKGIIYNFKLDTQPIKPLSTTSTVTTITLPQVAQETIFIDQYNFVPISLSEILTRDAVLEGGFINAFFDFVMSLLVDTATFDLFNTVNGLYQNWTPGQLSQTVEVPQVPTTGLVGADLQNTIIWNSTTMAKIMRITMNNMLIPNNSYTDQATYTDVNTGVTDIPIKTSLREDDLKLVVNDAFWTEFIGNSMAGLYHSQEVGQMIPGIDRVLLPTNAMTTSNSNTIGWLSQKIKFALAHFYRVTHAFPDASTLHTNTFYHYSYGAGIFSYAPGVKFVAAPVTAPAP